jgi:hypothetical protein
MSSTTLVADRRVLRRSLRVPCQLVRERDFRLIGRHVLDASEAGLLVSAEAPVLTGQPLLVSFQLPFRRTWIDAEMSVARVVHGRRPSDRGRSIGLVFEWIEPASRDALRDELRWFRAKSVHPRLDRKMRHPGSGETRTEMQQ